MLGSHGVARTFGPSPEFTVIDAVGLSPSQIKQMLDLFEFSQESEDKFRGVDGRKVTDHKALFEPAEDDRPRFVMTQEEREERAKEIDEINRKTVERIERERAEGVDVEKKYAKLSDHNLGPKEEA